MVITLERRQVAGGNNARRQWKRGGMMWCIEVSGSPNGCSDGEYAFNRKKDAVAVAEFARTEWDGTGDLSSEASDWMVRTEHHLAESYRGEF